MKSFSNQRSHSGRVQQHLAEFCGGMLLAAILAAGAVADEGAVLRGTVEFDSNHEKSWDGNELVVPLEEIPTELFERIEMPQIPFPSNWAKMKPEEQKKWADDFEASPAGNKLITEHEKRIESAERFDVKIEKNGKFVIYDVPPGIYGLRGRLDREIGGTTYGFEVFGQIEVLKEMDEVRLDPIQVAVTPQLRTGAVAPPLEVETHNGKAELTLSNFKDQYLFVSFWLTESPSAEYQKSIQTMFSSLKDKHNLRLMSICVDEDRKSAVQYIIEKQLSQGSHGFTGGFDHASVFNYGVRTIPSLWLIGPDGKILMSQYDFAQAFKIEKDLAIVVANLLEGKNLPTPAAATPEPSK